MSEKEKSSDRTPIMVSIQLHERLNTVKEQLRKIIGKKSLSLEKAIEILLTAKPLDLMLEDLILEAYPTLIHDEPKEQKYKVEMLASLEHQQWIHYNKGLPKEFQKPHLWIPYEELLDEEKEKDRVFARKVLELLKHL